MGVVQCRDGRDQSKSKPAARQVSAPIETIKPPQHVCAFPDWDPRTVIANARHYLTIPDEKLTPDSGSRGCMIKGIVDQIGE